MEDFRSRSGRKFIEPALFVKWKKSSPAGEPPDTAIILNFAFMASPISAWRQKAYSILYPLLRKWASKSKKLMKTHPSPPDPHESLYSLSLVRPGEEATPFTQWKGKKLLLTNTASACGYTPQYAELEQLHRQYGDKVQVLAFPSPDFGGQEPGDDAQIAAFCQTQFGISFPLASKSSVKSGPDQNPVFRWLTRSEKNGWLDQEPEWNFSKYLVSEDGRLMGYIGSAVSPLDPRITDWIEGKDSQTQT